MQYIDFINELAKARKLTLEFQSKVIMIIRYIRNHVYHPIDKGDWNRHAYYEKDEFSLSKFDMANYFEYRICEYDDGCKGKIAIDILQIMESEEKSMQDIIFKPCLIFMFTFQKPNVTGWPSWPDPKDSEWIRKSVTQQPTPYTFSKPLNSKDSVFIGQMVPIENLISEDYIDAELSSLNELFLKVVEDKCDCKINPIFHFRK